MFYFRLICVLRGSLHGDSDAALLRNSPESPQSATGILCNPLTMFARSSELGRSNLVKVLRRDGDSNPGNPFGVYTLSRRASSTTRASLLAHFFAPQNHRLGGSTSNSATKVLQIIDIRKFFGKYFLFSHILWLLFAYIKKIYYLCPPIKNNHLYVYHRHCGRYRLG